MTTQCKCEKLRQAQAEVDAVRSQMFQARATLDRLQAVRKRWWGWLVMDQNQFDIAVSAAASRLGDLAREEKDAFFRLKVLRDGQMAAEMERAAETIAFDIEKDTFGLAKRAHDILGLAKKVEEKGFACGCTLKDFCPQHDLRTHYVGDDCPGGHYDTSRTELYALYDHLTPQVLRNHLDAALEVALKKDVKSTVGGTIMLKPVSPPTPKKRSRS